MRSPKLLVVVLLAAAAVTAAGVTAAVTRAPDSTGVSRVERTIVQRWGSECDFDACAIQTRPVPYTTPAGVDSVDVTFTLTLDYRTSRGDAARVGVSLDDGTPPSRTMRPSYPLASARARTSTTLTWKRKDVPAAGQAYTFWFTGVPHDTNGDRRASVSGTRMTIVIESWTAGD